MSMYNLKLKFAAVACCRRTEKFFNYCTISCIVDLYIRNCGIANSFGVSMNLSLTKFIREKLSHRDAQTSRDFLLLSYHDLLLLL
jgi:hypothetical protein